MTLEASFNTPDLSALPNMVGPYTRRLLGEQSAAEAISPNEALRMLAGTMTPQNDRIVDFVARRFKIAPDAKEVRERLNTASTEKNLKLSSANLSQWIPSRASTAAKHEVSISSRNLFKLCLAMDLTLEESIQFTYDTLYQNWFNYRDAEDSIYIFMLGQKELFGNDAFATAQELTDWYNALDAATASMPLPQDCTGYTRTLSDQLQELIRRSFDSPEEAVAALKEHLSANRSLFTGIQRSARRVYQTYFSGEDDSTIVPLRDLYQQATGLSLPTTSYLEGRDPSGASTKKRLLWGTDLRSAWRAADPENKSFDILRNDEIAIERHAVERMQKNGILRGNMIAVLFFHYCLENRERFATEGSTAELFERFYRTTNLTLVDSCGMMPLHPRKPLDRLFLTALAQCGTTDPIEYLNEMLDTFYRQGL